jgi:glycosyltransferase involved in cell wall biosynthesis
MKILIAIPSLGAVYGGPSKSVVELAEALVNQGASVDIVTTNANGLEDLDVPLQTWISTSSYRIQYFPYLNLGYSKLNIGLTQWLISFSLTRWLFQQVPNYDLVHTNAIFSYPILPAHWACSYHRVPYVMTPHGMLDAWALAFKANKKRIYFSILERPALRRASMLQMLTHSEAQSVRELKLDVPLCIVPNGVRQEEFVVLPDPELFYQEFPNTRGKTLILFLGRIDPKKGLDLLATAFSSVNTKLSNVHLIVAGPDNIGFLPTAQSYFAEAGCLEHVTFTGLLTGLLKYAALAAASIYVAPSYSEGFSMSVLEGMASGLPCVITSACNFPEAETAQAAHVVGVNSDEIACALIQYLENPHQAIAVGARARQFIFENYTWDRIAAKMLEVYTHIINKSLTPSLQPITPKL